MNKMNFELDKFDINIININIERELTNMITNNPDEIFSDINIASAKETARKIFTAELLARKYDLDKTEAHELWKQCI